MRNLFLGILVACLTSAAQAQNQTVIDDPTQRLPENPTETTDVAPTAPVVPSPTVVEAPKPLGTQVLRGLSQWTGSLHLSPFSTWLPMKYGFSAGYVFNERWTVEGEYTQRSISADFKSVDFGKIVDRRFGIQSRWYPNTNSFNVILGFYRSEFVAELGNSVVNHMTTIPDADVLRFESYGPQLGLSNRWQWSPGVTFGVDWFVMYVPLFGKTDDNALKYVSQSNDRSNIDSVVSVVQNIPQFDILKISLGYNF